MRKLALTVAASVIVLTACGRTAAPLEPTADAPSVVSTATTSLGGANAQAAAVSDGNGAEVFALARPDAAATVQPQSVTACADAKTMTIYTQVRAGQPAYQVAQEYRCPLYTRVIAAHAVIARRGVEGRTISLLPGYIEEVSNDVAAGTTTFRVYTNWPRALLELGKAPNICVRINFTVLEPVPGGTPRNHPYYDRKCGFDAFHAAAQSTTLLGEQQVIRLGATEFLRPYQFRELRDKLAVVRSLTALTSVLATYYAFSSDSAIIKACMSVVDVSAAAYFANAAWQMAPIMARLDDPLIVPYWDRIGIRMNFVKLGALYAPYFFTLHLADDLGYNRLQSVYIDRP